VRGNPWFPRAANCDTRAVDAIVVGEDGVARCWWAGDDPLMRGYHDDEWGRPERRPDRLFELLILELFQSGLSWSTILKKREGFRHAFVDYDLERLARFDGRDVDRLLADAAIVRNRAKIEATIANAKAATALEEPLADLLWSFAPPRRARPRGVADLPSQTPESQVLARELKKRGFRFLGPTTGYAFMQAAGLVDDHVDGCAVPSAF
jgi:DNA-3-methyladenine glycosylase I